MDFLRLFFISIALTVCSITVKAEYFNLDTVAVVEVGYRHSIKDNMAWNLGVYLANSACGLRAGFEF